MEIINKDELRIRKEEIKQRILKGEIFIYPTDTIYGLGCNGILQSSVEKIRELKGRPKAPFSVIPPSVDWVLKNCEVTKEGEKHLKKLPGPLTLVFKCIDEKCIANAINPDVDTIGVRVPMHWFTVFLKEVGIPIVTTSANVVGNRFMTSLEDLDPEIKKGISFVIYEGPKKGKPSTIVNLTEKKRLAGISLGPKITKRK